MTLDRHPWPAAPCGGTLIGVWADGPAVLALIDGALHAVEVAGGAYPTLRNGWPAAAWMERVVAVHWGHRGGDDAAGPPPAPDGATRRAAGPIRPGQGPLSVTLDARDGRIVTATLAAGWTTRGIPALLQGTSPRNAARFAARVAAEATVAHATAFAAAAEAASGAVIPPRAAAWREVLGALERVRGHLSALGAVAALTATAAETARIAALEEQVLTAMAETTGAWAAMDVIVPGGLAVAPGEVDAIAGATAALAGVRALRRLLPRVRGRAGIAVALAARHGAPELAGDAAARLRRGILACGAEAAWLAGRLAALPADGPVAVTLPMSSGEALGQAAGPHGAVWCWLRLESGMIAAGFPADPAPRRLSLIEAALAGQDADDADLLLAGCPVMVGGMDL